jgi:hypothetical protein
MTSPRVEQIVRHFRENGLKLLLEVPANVRELVAVPPLVDRLAFSQLRVDPTTYIAADYRHLASDLVLRVPFRTPGARRAVLLYILIEHQSEPDRLIRWRIAEYVLQIYKRQERDRLARQESVVGFLFDPVLPLVLYTGTTAWPRLPHGVELVKQGAEFAGVIPDLEPRYVNLPELPAASLEAAGPFGWVLELLQQRRASPEEFRALLVRVVERLETMPRRERERWLELLSYIQALIYHDREVPEREGLREVIVDSVRTDERRQEVKTMGQTIAEALREEGRKEGLQQGAVGALQQALLNLLRTKFGRVPRAAEKTIRATDDSAQLDAWLVRAGTATTLEETGLVAGKPSPS